MSSRVLVLLAIAAFVVWWYRRRVVSTAAAPAVGSTVPTPTPAPSPPASPRQQQATRNTRDVAGDVGEGEHFVLLDNANNQYTAAQHGGWWQRAYEQLWLPASRLKLSELGKADWADAGGFLNNAGGEFTRRDELGELGAALVAEASDRAGAEAFTQAVSLVAGAIPIVGTFIAKVNAVQSGDLSAADAWSNAMGNGSLGSTFRSSINQESAASQHLLRNFADGQGQFSYQGVNVIMADGPNAPLDRRTMGWPEQLQIGPMQFFSPPVSFWTATGPSGEQVTFCVRMRLFSKYAGGWVLPWISWHTVGDTSQTYTCRQSVNAAARLLRMADALICAAEPYTREGGFYYVEHPEGAPWGTFPRGKIPGLYFYVNPLMGPMLGSIFPPTAEDRRYVGKDGRTYTFYGEPMIHGAADDSDVDPAARAAHVAQAASSAALGVPLPPPAPPPAVSVVERTPLPAPAPAPAPPPPTSTGGGIVRRVGLL